jgi:hypothetical protein
MVKAYKDHFLKYSGLYASETKRPSSVFSTLASLCCVRPLMALSHFLLLRPVWSFRAFRSTGGADFQQVQNQLFILGQLNALASGFICGKKRTSWMELWLVISMARRSMPMPMPEVGGMPYSRARTKSISMNMASSSPFSESFS